MLNLKDVTVRLGGRTIIDGASAALPPRAAHRPDRAQRRRQVDARAGDRRPARARQRQRRDAARARASAISRRKRPAAPRPPFETVLAADTERAALLDEAEHSHDPDRLGEIHERLNAIDAHSAPARAARILIGLGFDEEMQHQPARQLLRRLADARRPRLPALLRARPAAARRAFEPPRPRGGAVARGFPPILSGDDRDRQPRARLPQQCRRPHPPPRSRQADALSRRL